jgi:hypothetical protein
MTAPAGPCSATSTAARTKGRAWHDPDTPLTSAGPRKAVMAETSSTVPPASWLAR